MAQTLSREFVSKPTWNLFKAVGDARAAATGVGTMSAYLKRKYAYTQYRSLFGVAGRDDAGRVVFYPVDKAGRIDTTKELKSAQLNRILFNLAGVAIGGLIITKVQDPVLDYFALGVIAGDAANIALAALKLD